MGHHHEPLSSLGPVNWTDIPKDDLKSYLEDIFFDAQTVVDSVPSPSNPVEAVTKANQSGRGRAHTESALSSTNPPTGRLRTSAIIEQSQKLRQDWKDVKVNARENPLDVKVYKLGAKDGKGAWFARQSVHEGLSFEQWKQGLEEELIETMKVQGQPGGGSIRGIGADRLVEEIEVPGLGKAQVFHLSAQFPGPTSPRDFVTLFLTSDIPISGPEEGQLLRQHMIVSKPCVHPECSPRQGMIRGQYESIELIREIPSEHLGTKRSLSSADLPVTKHDGAEDASIRSEGMAPRGSSNVIEWLMVTRSDPGGSVPRFMIEKGTPPGIVNDASKFLKWVNSKSNKTSAGAENDLEDEKPDGSPVPLPNQSPQGVSKTPGNHVEFRVPSPGPEDESTGNGGLWGMVTGAFWGASSVVSAGLRKSFAGVDAKEEEENENEDEDEDNEEEENESESPTRDIDAEEDTLASDTSSIRTFTSALEKSSIQEETLSAMQSSPDDRSSGKSAQIKELKRLEERRRKLDEKATKLTERWENKRQEDKEKDAAAYNKAREKHEKEIAKQEAKYVRELRKLEEKRAQEERKAEDRRKKAAAREEKSNMALELEKVKAERDYALKQVDLLQNQIGELQSQNTILTAKLGRVNSMARSDSSSSKGTGQQPT